MRAAGIPDEYARLAESFLIERRGHRMILRVAVDIRRAQSHGEDDRHRLVYVHGGVGTGKTHMATWLFWNIHALKWWNYRDKENPALFAPQARWLSAYMVTHRMKAYDTERFSVLDVLREFTRDQVKTLLIDDIFADRATDTDYQNITQLVEMRKNNPEHHTILTGNLNVAEIGERSERLGDRIAGGTVIHCEGPSWRLTQGKAHG